jgi:hypothetical protein
VANADAKWVVLVRDGERKEGNQHGMGERCFIWAGTKEQRGGRCHPSSLGGITSC